MLIINKFPFIKALKLNLAYKNLSSIEIKLSSRALIDPQKYHNDRMQTSPFYQ